MTEKKHTICVLVANQFGVLARVSGMFSARGYNISSLCVGETDDPTVSRMTVIVRGDDSVLAQIMQQLNKLVDVIKVEDLTAASYVERELIMIRVAATGTVRSEVLGIVEIFRGKIVDLDAKCITVEVTGAQEKIQAFLEMMRGYGILEMVRTGEIAMARAANNSASQIRVQE
ncbi:MAG TPA: acetolactate synthase small subunit [Candidatus Hydrogenedentes bacterium]|jgi:acetolactate synthase-1/3 small subunit|nr:MAG: Acetolactate synthase small subunit [Candidatus Hydrogenedentes bacterium ADurb.Bin170]HNZ49376.1 acetolactate synthase small subunit [Candidatus Hydrogenedentota bacterium]HOD95291.1 acetolactate synthase small subunit [Candidatus Hydrogenedentota bacterium]HOR50746.1 acetolactate synthase small subunit [Candidatus Hydrogenedentota bacterium]HPK24608.1 acetolactate synthase small subunit [Candidatus Hydrogenedentota bacterium]